MSLLRKNIPGGLLTQLGGLLTADEELVIQAITAGTYFYVNETPAGTIDGVNTSFTLTATPNPTISLDVFLNGTKLTYNSDYTVSGATLTMVMVPQVDDILRVDYQASPV